MTTEAFDSSNREQLSTEEHEAMEEFVHCLAK
jgi:hypothetical protein